MTKPRLVHGTDPPALEHRGAGGLAGDDRGRVAEGARIIDVVRLQLASDAVEDALGQRADRVVNHRADDRVHRSLALHVVLEAALFAVGREVDADLRAAGAPLTGQLPTHVAEAL